MHQGHTEFRARPQQPRITERAAIVDVNRAGYPAGAQRGPQRSRQSHRIFGVAEPVAGRQPGMVVKKAEEVGFAVPDPRAVQCVADPQLVGVGGLEPAEHRRGRAGGRAHQIEPVEMAQQGRLRGCPPGSGAQDAGHLRGGAGGVFPLERGGQLQHLRVSAGPQLPRSRYQRLEPAAAVAADPAVQRPP